MQKRTILAFVLMALVLVVSQYLFTPAETGRRSPGAPSAGHEAARREETRDAEARKARRSRAEESRGTEARDGEDEAPADRYAVGAGGTLQVETPLYEMTLGENGVVRRVFLRRYPSYVDSLPVQLVPAGQAYFQRTIRAGARTIDLSALDFTSDRQALTVTERVDSLMLTAEHTEAGTIRQTFRFRPDSYVVDYRLRVGELPADGRELVTRLGPRLRSTEKNLQEDLGSFAAVARSQGRVLTFKPKDVADGSVTLRDATWAAIKSKYFLGAVVACEDPLQRVHVSSAPGGRQPGLDLAVTSPLANGSARYRFYLGPQEYRGLAAAGCRLEEINQYGWSWIRWLIQPFGDAIVRILLWMHQYVPNYGVVLVIFGVLVRLLMWPLTQRSFESMQKMQALQPEMQRLRERYKNDPQRMQQEIMRMYRERGVNPLGGCLPNLLPLPILFALFFVFQNTIEFRGAPFVGWIDDLSRPDPYYVLPILMGLSMYVQQKLTTTADNPQMKMMTYFMPAFLTFIFLKLASGLVLYYTVSNVLTVLQQVLLKRKHQAGATAPAPAK